MELNLEKLKKNFTVIKDIRNKVNNLFQILETHLIKLKQTYSEIMINNKDNLFVFGLDSFQFQSKLIDIEYEDMRRLFLAISNRMYCEYYKLYKIIAEYVKDNILDKKTMDIVKITNTFPVYKDLEPFKQYKFEVIQDIHENIILLLNSINDFILNKENELQWHQKKQDSGLNINNFVTTFNYNILMIKEKGMLFISYIDFFHSLHTKYLQRFAMKMNLMYSQITNDIRFDDATQSQQQTLSLSNEIKKQDILSPFQDVNINQNTINQNAINQIKKSFDDGDSILSESLVISNPQLQTISDHEISNLKKSKSIFKSNFKKVVNGGFNLFKSSKNLETDNLSSYSSESVLSKTSVQQDYNKNVTQTSVTNVYEKKDKVHNDSFSSDINSNTSIKELESNVSLMSLSKPVSDEDIAELNKTLTYDNMFTELNKQCFEFTNDNIGLKIEEDYSVIEAKEILDEIMTDELTNESVNEDGVVINEVINDLVNEVINDVINEKNIDNITQIENTNVENTEAIKEDSTINSEITENSFENNDNNDNNDNKDNNDNNDNDNSEIITETTTKKKRQYKPRKK